MGVLMDSEINSRVNPSAALRELELGSKPKGDSQLTCLNPNELLESEWADADIRN